MTAASRDFYRRIDAETAEVRAAKWVVWVNYGYEGWAPFTYETREEAEAEMRDRDWSGPAVLTEVTR